MESMLTPVIGLLVQGGPSDIDHILWLLKKKIPVVVIQGSGMAADLLGFAYNEMQERWVVLEGERGGCNGQWRMGGGERQGTFFSSFFFFFFFFFFTLGRGKEEKRRWGGGGGGRGGEGTSDDDGRGMCVCTFIRVMFMVFCTPHCVYLQ